MKSGNDYAGINEMSGEKREKQIDLLFYNFMKKEAYCTNLKK